MVPSRAQSFQARAEAGRLREAAGGGEAVLCQVLTGMGGVGKTQLAADFAHREWDERRVEVLVWVAAVSRSAVLAAYAQAAEELCGADPFDPERAAAVFLAWLRAKPHRWLVVLDDVADPGDLRDLWPPDSPVGRILVTTRRRDAALTGRGRRIDVGLFSTREAAAYLSGVLDTHGRTEPDEQLAALADDLGCLPLALSQAAAYLVDQALGVGEYRARLADRTRALDQALPAPGVLPDDQRAPVAATWSLSVELADRQDPRGIARPLLELAALLDPHGIPAAVLTSLPARVWCVVGRRRNTRWWRRRGDTASVVTGERIHEALRVLHRLSLIDHAPGTPHQAVRVHALIQRTTADTLTPDRLAACARAAADALLPAWPEIERDTDLARALRANAAVLADRAEPSGCLYRPDAHAVLFRAGRSLGEAGQAADARDHFRHLAATAAARLGPDHPDTLTSRHNLASLRGHAGDAAGAAAAFAELLQDRLRVLGPDRPDHPDILASRHNLAFWRGQAGDAAGAAAAFAELLNDQSRVLGADHPHTLTTRGNLAYWRGVAGDAAGAAAAFAELLQDRLRVLGPDHPGTLATRGNLARWRGEAGDAAGAAAASAELLQDQLRVLGPDHPDTLSTRGNLAYCRGTAGDTAGAAATFAELLQDRLRVLGPDHPDTLATRHNLAYWRGQAGDGAAFAELLEDLLRVLGPDHPHTLTTRHNLAHMRGRAGDAAGAAAAFAELLQDRLRVLGPDHPGTLSTRGNLARWRGEAGDAAGAAAAFAELLENRLRVLGPDHPDTLTARHNLAYWRGQAGATGNTG
ncbi:FxSxx-COOH system tetratricopeptide repeat protein [Streptomyces sp. NPDC020983]|uniref:FxSxx-COOH system tetratricopeptide repeat protein n=1 Tax=Streptomyces sp. NPDC020983 TaxID=3365106 RepID=UPI003794A848